MTRIISTAFLCLALLFGSTAVAKADPVDDYGPIVCARFDAAESITPNVLRSVGRYLKGQGFSDHDAASIVWDSVQTWCPRYSWSVSVIAHLAEQGVIR